MKSRNVVKVYMQIPGVYYIKSFYPVATDTSTINMIGLTLFQEEEEWVAEMCGMEALFLHPNLTV